MKNKNIPYESFQEYAVTDVNSIEEFIAKYCKPERSIGRGAEYVKAQLASHYEHLAKHGYDLITHHGSVTGKTVTYFPNIKQINAAYDQQCLDQRESLIDLGIDPASRTQDTPAQRRYVATRELIEAAEDEQRTREFSNEPWKYLPTADQVVAFYAKRYANPLPDGIGLEAGKLYSIPAQLSMGKSALKSVYPVAPEVEETSEEALAWYETTQYGDLYCKIEGRPEFLFLTRSDKDYWWQGDTNVYPFEFPYMGKY